MIDACTNKTEAVNNIGNNPTISVVSSLYYSENYIKEFCYRCQQAVSSTGLSYELILVDDGSPDHSLQRAKQEKQNNCNLRIFKLSRNFGHHKALHAGLAQAKGQYIFLIDSDLEEMPEMFEVFWENMISDSSIDVVYGVQENKRKGGLVERVSGNLFYKYFNKICSLDYKANQLTSRLMKRNYVEMLLQYPEREFDLWSLFSLSGYKQVSIPVKKYSKGKTTYSFRHKVNVGIDMITSFSAQPLRLVLYIGIVTTFISVMAVFIVIFQKILSPDIPLGWTSLIVSVWLFGSLSLLSIGLVGIYLSKIFLEVKRRPLYHVHEVL